MKSKGTHPLSNDPRLTAFALGELQDPEISAAVAASPELQAEVAEIRNMAAALSGRFATEADPLATSSPAEVRTAPSFARRWWVPLSGALAACLALVIVFPGLKIMEENDSTDLHLSDRPFVNVGHNPAPPASEALAETDDADRAAAYRRRQEAAVAEHLSAVASQKAAQPVTSESRVNLPIRDTPMSIDVVTGSMIDEMAIDSVTVGSGSTFRDSLQYSAGVYTGDFKKEEQSYGGFPGSMVSPAEPFNREAYDSITETGFVSPGVQPLSTFSIDVDTASYANVRRLIQQGSQVPSGAVRIEEFINYFDYSYTAPTAKDVPFAVHLEASHAPWNPKHQLVRIGLKGYEVPWEQRPPSNLVFLVDVSGSMNSPNKLPLVKESLKLLVERLGEQDRVAIVTYAGSSAVALPSTTANNHETIHHAIDSLGAGGSTHGSAGIRTAYQLARRHFIEGGANRVILCSDGDFNVGTTSRSELVELIETEAKTGVYLGIMGFGMGNYQDAMLEELSNKGNGNYAYIDSIQEARKTFVEATAGTLITIAKDVKIQVEFNPAHVQAYRLIGYENRALAAQDFNDDTKDAGEIGAGHDVTALYEIVPVGVDMDSLPGVDPLRYQAPATAPSDGAGDELLLVKLRYKAPDADDSQKIEVPLAASAIRPLDQTSADFRWASSVAAFGMLVRESEHAGAADLNLVLKLARGAIGTSPDTYRQEFIRLVEQYQSLTSAR